jgi:hypothetical protein
MTIDDPKTVGLWCREHYPFYCQPVPPKETDNRTYCRWKWTQNKQDRMWSELDIEGINSNGLWFAPMCIVCFLMNKYIGIGEKLCSHSWKEHWFNTNSEYILFPSVWFHWGYFNRRWRKVYIQAQLFAVPSRNQCTDWSTCSVSQGSTTDWVTSKVGYVHNFRS